jgi:cytochrome P450
MTSQTEKLADKFQAISETFDSGGITDPFPLLAKLRAETPVAMGDILAQFGIPSQADSTQSGRPVMTLYRHADVSEAYRNADNWTSALLMEGLGQFLGDVMLTGLNGDAHRKLRSLLSPWFAPARLRKFGDSVITPMVRDYYLKPLRPRGQMEMMSELALPYPIRVVYAMLGFPEEKAERFATQALTILGSFNADPETREAAQMAAFQASEEQYADIRAILDSRRASGNLDGDDLISFLMQAEFEGLKLDDHRIANVVKMLLPAAAETTTRTMGTLIVHLFENPEVLDQVKADRTLIPKALTESMRYDPVAGFMARQAHCDVTLSGTLVPKDTAVCLAVSAAHRDPDVFENPDRFDIDRPSKAMLGFGYGVHLCLGMPVAKMEIEAAVNALLDLPNLRLDPGQPKPKILGLHMRGPDAIHLKWDM